MVLVGLDLFFSFGVCVVCKCLGFCCCFFFVLPTLNLNSLFALSSSFVVPCQMSVLVGLIFHNSTNTYSPKKTWLWYSSIEVMPAYRFCHLTAMSRKDIFQPCRILFTTSLILPNCSPAWISILPHFSAAAFPFHMTPQPPSSLQCSSSAFLPVISSLEVSEHVTRDWCS